MLLSDGKGGIKQDLTGPRAGGKGAAIGAILGLIAAVPTGGLSLLGGILGGGVGGGIIGSFSHKHLGMSEQEREGLTKEIAGGSASSAAPSSTVARTCRMCMPSRPVTS